MRKKIANLWQKLDFFRIYSRTGFLVLFGVVSWLSYFISNFFHAYNLLNQALNGADIKSQYVSSAGVLVVAVVFFIACYFLIFTLLVIVLRWVLHRRLNKDSVWMQQIGNKLRVQFPSKVWSGFFFIEAKLVLKSETVGTKLSLRTPKISGYLNHQEILVNLESLPTGKYQIEQIIWSLHDPFQMFWTILRPKRAQSMSITVHHGWKNSVVLNQTRVPDIRDAEQTVMERDPTEEFYSTREYIPGERLKKIHWKNTAKTHKLMMRMPEAKPLYKEETTIVLNAYSPYLSSIDQTVAIGRFLDAVIANLAQYFQEKHHGMVRLYANNRGGTGATMIEVHDLYSLPATIVNNALFQDQRTYLQFHKNYKITGEMVFSLSSDLINDKTIKKKYIYPMRRSLFPARNIFATFFSTSFQAPSLNLIRWVGNIRVAWLRKKFKRALIENERYYYQDKATTYLS